MKYKSVVVTKRGGPDILQIVENDLRPPAAKEARVKVLAAGVGRTDINYRYGLSRFAPKIPFVPGYEIHPVIDAKFSILEARNANEVLESGNVTGNIVMLAPELLGTR